MAEKEDEKYDVLEKIGTFVLVSTTFYLACPILHTMAWNAYRSLRVQARDHSV
jgi:hypothetical protein